MIFYSYTSITPKLVSPRDSTSHHLYNTMRNQHLHRSFKSEQSSNKHKTLHGIDAATNVCHAHNQKKFFDIQYIFEDPVTIKPRRYRFQPKMQTNRSSEKNYKTLEPQIDMSASVVLKPDQNILKIQPIKQKQLYFMQKTDLSFDKDTKTNSIHSRKMSLTSSIVRSSSSKKQERATTIQVKPFQGLLSSKNYSFHRETRSADKQKRRVRVERNKRKVQTNDSSLANRGIKRISKMLQSNQFQRYCEKNIELAKNAFLLKNKQTIRIYRPWSPINLEEGFIDYEFGQAK